MLIHLIPKFLTPQAAPFACSLIDVRSPELGLLLREGKELKVARPFPNKRYLVASVKAKRLAQIGFFVSTDKPVSDFTVITRWRLAGDRVVIHHVQYVVLDQEHDMVSTDMTCWLVTAPSGHLLEDRRPAISRGWSAAGAHPRMEAEPGRVQGNFCDRMDSVGILERSEVFQLPSLPREPTLNPISPEKRRRWPTLADAFSAEINDQSPDWSETDHQQEALNP